jgi:hypothetical protein
MSPSTRSSPGRTASPLAVRTFRRAVLALGVLAGLLLPVYFLAVAETTYFARDFHAYYAAADAALDGRPFVGADSGYPGAAYVYLPITVLLFLPGAAVGGWQTAFAIQTAINAAAAVTLAALTVRIVERRGPSIAAVDRRLLGAFVLLAAPSLAVLGLGQVDTLVALALAGGFLAVERDREWLAGVAFGAAALVKLFPAALGLWLLYRRSWRAVAGAVATGLSGLAAGAVLFGVDAYRRYREVLAGRSRLDEFAGTVSPDFFAMSLHRPLSQLFPELDPLLYLPIAAGLLLPPVAAAARHERRFAGRLRTFLAALIATLLFSPASNSVYVVYVFFPVLCLLYLDAGGRNRLPLLAGVAAIGVPIQPAQVGAALAAVGVPPAIRVPVLDAANAVLTVGSVPLFGLLAVLCWCALPAAARDERRSGSMAPIGAD